MNAEWVWLAAAILTQWLSVTSLRASDGMRRYGWTALTFVAMTTSVGCIAVALTEGLTVAVAYGVWTGAGVALAALTGAVVFRDRLTRSQWAGVILVLMGVAALG